MSEGRALRLYREPEEKKLAGVCGGLADYFGLDPTVVRLAAVVIGVATGFAGVVVYIVAAVVIPLRPEGVARVQAPPTSFNTGLGKSNALFISLLVIAVLVLVGGHWSWWWFETPILGLMLVAVGIWLLFSNDERRVEEIPSAPATWSAGATTLTDDVTPVGSRGEVSPPIPPRGPTTAPTAPVPPPPPAPPPPRSRGLFAGVVALLLVVMGVVALLAVFDVWDLDLEQAIGVVLVVVGAGLVVGAWRGHARALLAIGLPALGMLVLADTINVPLDGGSGDRRIDVDTLAELEDLDPTQEMLAGELVLDLSDVPFGRPGRPARDVEVDVGLGSLQILLPREVTADVDVSVGLGSIQIDGRDEGGVDIDRSFTLEGEPRGGHVNLDLHVGIGEVEVIRG